MGPQRPDGTRSIRGLVDAETGALLEAVLAKEAAPGVNNPDHEPVADHEPSADGEPRADLEPGADPGPLSIPSRARPRLSRRASTPALKVSAITML